MFDNTEVFENSLRGFVECLGGELHTLMLAPSGFFTIFDRVSQAQYFRRLRDPFYVERDISAIIMCIT